MAYLPVISIDSAQVSDDFRKIWQSVFFAFPQSKLGFFSAKR